MFQEMGNRVSEAVMKEIQRSIQYKEKGGYIVALLKYPIDFHGLVRQSNDSNFFPNGQDEVTFEEKLWP